MLRVCWNFQELNSTGFAVLCDLLMGQGNPPVFLLHYLDFTGPLWYLTCHLQNYVVMEGCISTPDLINIHWGFFEP